MRFKKILPVLLIILLLTSNTVMAITAEEIVNRRDDNEFVEKAKIEAEMIIVNGDREMTKSMVYLIEGDKAFVRFTNPRDRGTKYLKRGDDLFLFYPEAEDLVKLSGHSLNRSMAGSDYSFRDMMESDKLTELYKFKVIGREEMDGRNCYKLEGIAKEGEEVSYYRRVIWVDLERFIGLREELYAQSGRLLKVSRVEEIRKIDERWYPMKAVMENKLRKNTRTIFAIKSIKFNPEIPAGTFSLQNLQ